METEKKLSKWTEWTEIGDGKVAMYKTNFKKVRVRLLNSDIHAESCCSRYDTFNLTFGIRMAYLRCLVKTYKKMKSDCAYVGASNKVGMTIDTAIDIFEKDIQQMIESLEN